MYFNLTIQAAVVVVLSVDGVASWPLESLRFVHRPNHVRPTQNMLFTEFSSAVVDSLAMLEVALANKEYTKCTLISTNIKETKNSPTSHN